MKWQIIVISMLVFVFMSFSAVWANEEASGTSEAQISTPNMASITPLMKGSSSSGSKSSSSSSSKTKTKDGDDATDDNSTSNDSSGFPWWIFIVIVIVVLGIVGFVVWYLFLR
jgi:cobalamin biosynthesis Mg chelatase CobN